MRALPLTCVLVLLALQLGAAEAQRDELPPAPPVRPMTLAEIDRALEAMKNASWSLPEELGYPGPTPDGIRIDDDIARYLVTEPVLQEVTALRRELPASIPPGSDLVPIVALEPLRRLVEAEGCRAVTLYGIWGSRRVVDVHVQLMVQLLAQLPTSSQAAWRERVRAIDARWAAFYEMMPKAMESCEGRSPLERLAILRDIPALFAEANQLRGELAAAVEALPADVTAEPEWMTRPRSCPASSAITTGTPRPRLISQPDPANYYPRDAMMNSVEGSLRVRVEMDATGCVTRTAIAQSSGAPELDRAGMLMAFDIQFVPGETDGKAEGARFIQPITFSLREFGPRAGAAQPQP